MKIEKLNEKVDWKVAMEGNNSNIDRLRNVATQVNIDPVMGEVVRENEKSDKMTGDTFKKLSKELDGITPKDPDTGKKITIKPYTEKLTLDENLFKESWTSFGGSWRNQTVKKVNYEEEDISDVAEELMNWYGEYFEGWEGPDIKDALYGLNGERIPGSDCPIIFTMEEDEDDELDLGYEDEEYGESLKEKKSSKKKKHLCESVDEPIAVLSLNNFGGIEIYDINDEEVTYAINDGNNISEKETVELKWDCEDEDGDCSPYFNVGDSQYYIRDFIKTKMFESKKLHESDSGIEYRDMMYDMVENGDVDAGEILRDLIYWVTEDDMEEFMRIRNLIPKEDMEESLSLNEYVDENEVVDDEYTVMDLLNDRLFGYGINKNNFRLKWKFADVDPLIKNEQGKIKRGYFYPTADKENIIHGMKTDRRSFTMDGVGVFVYDEEEAELARKAAEELGLEFSMKKTRPGNAFDYVAIIKVPEAIQEMPVKDYVESIGKSMSDFLRGTHKGFKKDFVNHPNYEFRKESEE
ncbi:MAG: hypothetical protein J6V44_09985 [Methanobrevibacter sp.]|nr:hypothetical protein [Methanobrevibacter sp.]MBO7695165.1 hypothetical protein [Methanobrevibacter sp.]